MRPRGLGVLIIATAVLACTPLAAEQPVGITATLDKVEVRHGERTVTILRNQDTRATVTPAFALTSRPCPPFCIQPMALAPGVETIGELEMLDYLQRVADGDVLVIDSRTADWVARGTIPGSINVPWTRLDPLRGADPIGIGELLEVRFGAQNLEGLWDFSNAKTLVLFCNGMWCGQSPNNIRNLLKFGYPADKLKWYRGGMQSWEALGLTTVQAAK